MGTGRGCFLMDFLFCAIKATETIPLQTCSGMLCYSQANCMSLASSECLHKDLVQLLVSQFFSLPYFLCHFPLPEQISVLIWVYGDLLLMCLWSSLAPDSLWWVSHRNECLCFHPRTHLQAQEEGRRPTLCTLHVGLSEVRRATSAWRFIEGVICKATGKSHATKTWHCFCNHPNSLVSSNLKWTQLYATSSLLIKVPSRARVVRQILAFKLCYGPGTLRATCAIVLESRSSSAAAVWCCSAGMAAVWANWLDSVPRDLRLYGEYCTDSSTLPSILLIWLKKHIAVVAKALTWLFCNLSKPQAAEQGVRTCRAVSHVVHCKIVKILS